MGLNQNICEIPQSIEAFPKLQSWKSSLEIRGFARL
jgi:hypothetical protein